ncbi:MULTISPECIES: hypothetical protein [Hyphomicrobiales]|jgi:hypothetical protein|nr:MULTISPECIES: hypothetical protein [Hyphomicrobiales]
MSIDIALIITARNAGLELPSRLWRFMAQVEETGIGFLGHGAVDPGEGECQRYLNQIMQVCVRSGYRACSAHLTQ